MIKKRLLILANRLDQIAKRPPKTRRFDLGVWDCGSACCAVGEAGYIKEFRALGFRVKIAPIFQDEFGWSAVHKFFDIDSRTAHWLFDESAYEGDHTKPNEVAARIRQFVGGA